eukprot:g3427.t1
MATEDAESRVFEDAVARAVRERAIFDAVTAPFVPFYSSESPSASLVPSPSKATNRSIYRKGQEWLAYARSRPRGRHVREKNSSIARNVLNDALLRCPEKTLPKVPLSTKMQELLGWSYRDRAAIARSAEAAKEEAIIAEKNLPSDAPSVSRRRRPVVRATSIVAAARKVARRRRTASQPFYRGDFGVRGSKKSFSRKTLGVAPRHTHAHRNARVVVSRDTSSAHDDRKQPKFFTARSEMKLNISTPFVDAFKSPHKLIRNERGRGGEVSLSALSRLRELAERSQANALAVPPSRDETSRPTTELSNWNAEDETSPIVL